MTPARCDAAVVGVACVGMREAFKSFNLSQLIRSMSSTSHRNQFLEPDCPQPGESHVVGADRGEDDPALWCLISLVAFRINEVLIDFGFDIIAAGSQFGRAKFG
jgi:hypothetical protein